MGILNITPDSFYDGGNLNSLNIKKKFNKVVSSDIIDIGAESTRPGAEPLTEKIELERIENFLNLNLNHNFFSIDSYKPRVIEFCLKNGFNMINDISGGGDNFINIDIACKYNVPIVLMHMKGNPANMQIKPKYNNLIDEISCFFETRLNYISKIGMSMKKIILDPGIGFGKTFNDNYEIIKKINNFKKFNCRILIGLSRKSMLNFNGNSPHQRLYKSLSMQAVSVLNGADIIRTHDPVETRDSLEPILELKKY